jgi:hypothetical protein
MSTVALNRLQAKRRSARLALNASVRLDGEDRQKCAFTLLPARATGLNRHGAAIQVGRELLVGSTLSMRHGRGGVKTSARIVAQVSAGKGSFTYGIEFLDSDATRDFWGIAFPSVENKGTAAHLAEQSGVGRRRSAIPSHRS